MPRLGVDAVRRPIFWFLWPPAATGPLDEQATQSRWQRVCARGPWRLALLIACTAALVTLVPPVVMAFMASPSVLAALVTLVVAVPVVSLLSRAWVSGTYVSDRGVKVSTVLTTQTIPWTGVLAIAAEPTSHLLGLPIRVSGESVVIASASERVPTHIATLSPDLWLRPSAYAAARDRLTTWWRETR